MLHFTSCAGDGDTLAGNASIPDNPRPAATRMLVPTTLRDIACLCVYGETTCSAAWLEAAQAQWPEPPRLVLLGVNAAVAPERAALRLPAIRATDAHGAIEAIGTQVEGAVIIVRSDAQLPPFAVERLLRALELDDVVAASALDNLASERSPLSSGSRSDAAPNRIDALCHAYGARQLIDSDSVSPLASAWHVARWQRSQAGGVTASNLSIVLLDHLYVAASGLALDGPALPSADRDPLPPSPLAELRESMRMALVSPLMPGYAGLDGKPVILHVLHGWGGGAERWVRDFSSAFSDAHHRVLVARGSHQRKRHGEWLELLDGQLHGPPLRRVALPVAIIDTDVSNAGYRDLLGEIVRDYAIDSVVVSSLIGHSLDALRTGLPTIRIVHDHYPLWPVLHRDFGDASLAFDDAQRAADLAALDPDNEFALRDAAYWKTLRDATVATLLAGDVRLVAPSRSALAADLRLAPELARLHRDVIAHGLEPWPDDALRFTRVPKRERLRLVVPGRVRRGKGAVLLARLLPRVHEFADVFLLGAGADAHRFFGMNGVHIVLDYQCADLPTLLATLAPDAALLLSSVSETFGYTLSELRALGVPVMATRIGAFVERIEDGVDGFLVDADADAIAGRLRSLAADREPIAQVRAHLRERREPDLADMARAYARLLHLPATAHARALATADTRSLQLSEHAARIVEARDRMRTLETDLHDVRIESARRGEWGHALNREVDAMQARLRSAHDDLQSVHAELEERTRWATSLDAELGELRPAYENTIRSRSWRMTAPLRASATQLRMLRMKLLFRLNHVRSALRRLRGSLLRNGIAGTFARALREVRRPTPVHAPKRYAEPDDAFAPFALPTHPAPRVSIVIPVHDKFPYTAACLRSLAEHAHQITFEVIVVDDCSSDATAERLAQIDGVRSLRNVQNLGFVGSCNAGAAVAIGEFVLFLNNDTVVTPGWLEALVDGFDSDADVGLVGAQLVYPDGRLQEAGGIIFNDGSGWNYGRFDDPDDPRYQYRRDADYCSGAAILTRRALFDSLGGFDARYAPAYYEDVDLAFSVRAAGLKVRYAPRARVIHFEGVSAGTDTAGSGMKRYQVINQQKFIDKWRTELAAQPAPGTPIARAATHRALRRILIIDATTPTPDRDAGSLRMVNLMRVLLRNGFHVVFMASNRAWSDRYTGELQHLGIEVLYHPWSPEPVEMMRERGAEFDTIMLSRHYVASEYIGLARMHAPNAKLIFDTVDLHYLREQRAAELDGRADLARQAASTRRQETRIMRECDLTLVVSPVEKALLANDAPGVSVDVLSTVNEVFGCRRAFAQRRDLVFVGSFQHPPNIDAMRWYVREVHPLVLAVRADIVLHVIGSQITDEVLALASDNVRVHGFVEDIAPCMDCSRVSIAPLRYGAGVKGKINTAMSYGLPVVATTMAVEGMHFRAGEDVMVADTAADFADAVLSLYADETLWNRLSRNGLANVEKHFSFAAAETAARRILGF